MIHQWKQEFAIPMPSHDSGLEGPFQKTPLALVSGGDEHGLQRLGKLSR